MRARLLSPGTTVQMKMCRHCVESWIITRREYEARGLRREPTVPCDYEHVQGTVDLYDMQYSTGVFPVLFNDGISRNVMADDVCVVVPDAEQPPADVVKIRRTGAA